MDKHADRWNGDAIKALFDETHDNDAQRFIRVNSLVPFEGQPFKPYSAHKMAEMMESIKENGILNPLLVRPYKKDKYEIIAGHNRWNAAKEVGLREVPAIVKEVDDAAAAIMMVDTNLNQRDEILPSEKAYAYKIKLNAMKNQGGRSDLTSGHSDLKFQGKQARDILAEGSNESGTKIRRYIRLTELIPSLLEKVDSGALGFIPAVDISYLTKEQQGYVEDVMDISKVKPTKVQAAELKRLSQEKKLTKKAVQSILTSKKENKFSSWKASAKFKSLLPPKLQKEITPDKADAILEEAMNYWLEKHKEEYAE